MHRALERHIGLPAVAVDAPYLAGSLQHVRQVLVGHGDRDKGQVGYHEDNAERCHHIERRLRRLGLAFLFLTLVACALHLAPALNEPHLLPSGLLVFLSAFLPAAGAALVGINNQGEFLRIAKRSEAMAAQLRSLGSRVEDYQRSLLAAPPASTPDRAQVVELAQEVAQLMVNEVLDWRVVFLDRPLEPPS